MRRIDFIINDVRSISKNDLNPDGTASISDSEILRYLNDAKARLQGVISSQNPSNHPFLVEKILSAVANQDGYSINDRIFYNKEFALVEFSPTGAVTDYTKLDKVSLFNRSTITSEYPEAYYIRFGKIYPVPVLSSSLGTFRILYERTLDDLDKRRGTVSVVTGLTSTTFTSITIGSDADETSTPNLSTIDYVCIVDKDGTVKAYNIPVGSYDTGTNVLTPFAGFTFLNAGDSIASGDYVVFGKWTTTHCSLPDPCERYLIHYAAESILHKDSSDDVVMQSNILQAIEDDIKKSFAGQTPEVQAIPQLYYGEWW